MEALALQQLQDGLIDFETALARISARVLRPVGGALLDPQALVKRSVDGKVMLRSVTEAFQPEVTPSAERRKIVLVPVNSALVFDGLTPPPTAMPVASERAPRSVSRPADAEVVTVAHPAEGVAVITLRDEAHRNMFTDALSRQLRAALDAVVAREETRAVVVYGYGNWFCSGGTPELLEKIRRGEASFLDDLTFRLLLDCPLPTISAMSGHALGGGLTFGLYADIVVMAEQSFYAANFMNHGFTPGVGATFLFPHKLGPVLGNEMLMTASRYQGRDLKARSVPVSVVPKEQVLPHALTMASQMAAMPKAQVTALKARLAEPVRNALTHVLPAEQSLHDSVFAEHRQRNGNGHKVEAAR